MILVSLLLPMRSFNFMNKKAFAVVVEINGAATVQGLDQVDSISLKKEMKLRHLDLIKTEAATEVLIVLPETGGEFRIMENSEALLEEMDSGATLVTLRQGDVLVDKFGQKPSFWVRKEGRQLSAMDYALTYEKNADLLRANGQMVQGSNDFLSQGKIEEILNGKKSDFFRCYGQLIQKTEQAHGQVLLSFEILPLGKVSKVEITKSDIEDSSFKACITEVVARTMFPRFSGEAITTVFPLKFE